MQAFKYLKYLFVTGYFENDEPVLNEIRTILAKERVKVLMTNELAIIKEALSIFSKVPPAILSGETIEIGDIVVMRSTLVVDGKEVPAFVLQNNGDLKVSVSFPEIVQELIKVIAQKRVFQVLSPPWLFIDEVNNDGGRTLPSTWAINSQLNKLKIAVYVEQFITVVPGGFSVFGSHFSGDTYSTLEETLLTIRQKCITE